MPDRPIRTPVDALLASVSCPARVGALVESWGGGSGYLTGPSTSGVGMMYRIRSGRIGEWVVLDVGFDGSVLVSHWVDRLVEARSVDPAGCGESTLAVETDSASVGFTDGDLRSLLREVGTGAIVVYTWSPHMPLSVDGYAEIERAAAPLDVRVVPVLMAGGNRDFARREADRVGIPADGLREVASVELWMRDAQVHAPSIIVFADGRASPVLPGYRNASAYRSYLASVLTDGR